MYLCLRGRKGEAEVLEDRGDVVTGVGEEDVQQSFACIGVYLELQMVLRMLLLLSIVEVMKVQSRG